ncbi:MAG: D-alanyl-D-alanine carboxypeptidase family protein, partial [Spirochaetales bacterium]|nr:D-alanyl-D-alanine carboxypeptidase family protein [Spirochaetales bacterium]
MKLKIAVTGRRMKTGHGLQTWIQGKAYNAVGAENPHRRKSGFFLRGFSRGSVPLVFPAVLVFLFSWAALSGCADDKTAASQTSARNPAAAPRSSDQEEEIIHPAFNIRPRGLAVLTSDLPAASREAIHAQPESFLGFMAQVLSRQEGLSRNPDGLLVLVDKNHPLPEGWEPSDLVNLKDYPALRLSRDNLQMRAVVMRDLLAMNEAAKADGADLLLSSTYRSAAYQKTVYERNVREIGQAAADRESSRPRHSQ